MTPLAALLLLLSMLCMVGGGFIDATGRKKIGMVSKKNLWVFGVYLAIVSTALSVMPVAAV